MRRADQLAQAFEQIDLQAAGHLVMVAMGAAERLFDHVVDHAEAGSGPWKSASAPWRLARR